MKLEKRHARIWELLGELNGREMRLYRASRRELFERLDRPALKPLPVGRFEYAEWKRARVNIFCGVPPYVAAGAVLHGPVDAVVRPTAT